MCAIVHVCVSLCVYVINCRILPMPIIRVIRWPGWNVVESSSQHRRRIIAIASIVFLFLRWLFSFVGCTWEHLKHTRSNTCNRNTSNILSSLIRQHISTISNTWFIISTKFKLVLYNFYCARLRHHSSTCKNAPSVCAAQWPPKWLILAGCRCRRRRYACRCRS